MYMSNVACKMDVDGKGNGSLGIRICTWLWSSKH